MAATTRRGTKTITSQLDDTVQELLTQRKRPDSGRFRLQVDRQTKGSYATYEAAEAAGMAIKKDYPMLQVAVYDSVEKIPDRPFFSKSFADCYSPPPANTIGWSRPCLPILHPRPTGYRRDAVFS